MSTRSTLPYSLNKRSISDCRASYSKFPQYTGLILAAISSAATHQHESFCRLRENNLQRHPTLAIINTKPLKFKPRPKSPSAKEFRAKKNKRNGRRCCQFYLPQSREQNYDQRGCDWNKRIHGKLFGLSDGDGSGAPFSFERAREEALVLGCKNLDLA